MHMKKKNTLLSLMIVLAVIISSLSFPGDNAFAAKKKIKLNKSTLSLYVKKTYTLKLSGVKKKSKIKWSSSSKKIATVNKNGKITAKKNGKCNIYAKYGKKKYKCKLTVKTKKKKTTKPTKKPSVKKTPSPTTKATTKPDNGDNSTNKTFPPNVTVKPDTPVVNTPIPVPTKKPLFTSSPDASKTPNASAAPGTVSSQPSTATNKPQDSTPDTTAKPDTTVSAAPAPTTAATALPTKKPSATAPSIISTKAQTVKPVVDPTDDATLDALAGKVTAKVQAFYGHVLISLKNESTDWINTLNIGYSFYSSDVTKASADTKGDYEILTDTSVQSDIAPGETRYVTADSSTFDDPYDISVASTDITLSVTNEETESGSYKTIDSSLINISIGDTDTEHLTLPVTVKNNSDNITTVSYLVYLYNDKNQIVDTLADSVSVQASGSITSTYQLPYYTDTSLKNICLATDALLSPLSTASAFIERNYDEELRTYAKNVSVKVSTVKYLSHAELTVTNNNAITLSSVTVSSTFYNSANEQIDTEDSSLLSIMPGETQYMAVKIDSELLSQIDLSKTQFDVSVQEDNATFSYSKPIEESESENYDCLVSYPTLNYAYLDSFADDDGNLTDEPTVDVSIENKSLDNIDVSFELLFRTSATKNYDVYTESISAAAGETTTVTVPLPYSVKTIVTQEKDEETGEMTDGDVKTVYVLEDGLNYSIRYTLHRLTDISMNTAKK